MSIGEHQSSKAQSVSWITPIEIIDSLGPFDLDPCESKPQPWPCARASYTIDDDGLSKEWHGRVWLNPPYSNPQIIKWLKRMADHNNGIALIFARTETEAFQTVWESASGLVFLYGRLHFHYPDGRRANANSGAPSVLIAYGEKNRKILFDSNIPGARVIVL